MAVQEPALPVSPQQPYTGAGPGPDRLKEYEFTATYQAGGPQGHLGLKTNGTFTNAVATLNRDVNSEHIPLEPGHATQLTFNKNIVELSLNKALQLKGLLKSVKGKLYDPEFHNPIMEKLKAAVYSFETEDGQSIKPDNFDTLRTMKKTKIILASDDGRALVKKEHASKYPDALVVPDELADDVESVSEELEHEIEENFDELMELFISYKAYIASRSGSQDKDIEKKKDETSLESRSQLRERAPTRRTQEQEVEEPSEFIVSPTGYMKKMAVASLSLLEAHRKQRKEKEQATEQIREEHRIVDAETRRREIKDEEVKRVQEKHDIGVGFVQAAAPKEVVLSENEYAQYNEDVFIPASVWAKYENSKKSIKSDPSNRQENVNIFIIDDEQFTKLNDAVTQLKAELVGLPKEIIAQLPDPFALLKNNARREHL